MNEPKKTAAQEWEELGAAFRELLRALLAELRKNPRLVIWFCVAYMVASFIAEVTT